MTQSHPQRRRLAAPATVSPSGRRVLGFTLVELLVVIGIIALLISILLPTLSSARKSAKQLKCSSNLRSVGQGFALFAADNETRMPAAYIYNFDESLGVAEVGNTGTAAQPTLGYTHWTWFIYGEGETGEEAFTCPEMPFGGGLPATNPEDVASVEGQQRDPNTNAGIVDQQVERTAYTVNEAILPRNKFDNAIRSAEGTPRPLLAQRTKITMVDNSAGVILATEFHRNPLVHQGTQSNGQTAGDGVIKSHRPVHGYESAQGSIELTDFQIGEPIFPARRPPVEFALDDPFYSQLFYVGRNHGSDNAPTTNFLFVDGHVDNMTIEQTLPVSDDNPRGDNFKWGNTIWSVRSMPQVRFNND